MNRGFSLIELAIVIVIVGLLAGGIVVGQSLVHSAELNSIIGDYQRYKSAIQTFHDKYAALPGDMTNATSYWGKDNADCGGDTGTAATPGTCNGNGDKLISYATAATSRESYRFWQQLSLDGLIEGNYTGTGTIGDPNTNVPPGRLTGSGWTPVSLAPNGAEFNYTDGDTKFGNYLVFGTVSQTIYPNIAILMPRDAFSIDNKFDDGKPGTGIVKSNNDSSIPGNDNCATSNTIAAQYNTTSKLVDCWMGFAF